MAGRDRGLVTLTPIEKYYTLSEIAEEWHLSPEKIRRLFMNQKDIMRVTEPKRGTRSYVTYRIPEKVKQRVHRLLSP